MFVCTLNSEFLFVVVFQKLRLPAKSERAPVSKKDLDDFIVSDSDVTDEESDSLPDLNVTHDDDLAL
jgi:hypothetical protein